MQVKSRNILQQRADEDRRARLEVSRQRMEYARTVSKWVRSRPLTYKPFAGLPEKIFKEEE